jgi:hypothetical protein
MTSPSQETPHDPQIDTSYTGRIATLERELVEARELLGEALPYLENYRGYTLLHDASVAHITDIDAIMKRLKGTKP